MSRFPRVPIAVVTVSAVLGAGLVMLAGGRDASAAARPPSMGMVSLDETEPSYRSAMSSDGRTIAYQTGSGRSKIQVRTIDDNKVVTLPTDLSASTPSMSGDGGLISFLGDETGTPPDPVDPQILVANRRDPANVVITPVTGTANDLPYQRMVRCRINTGDGDDEDCEPELSRDGRTLVAPLDQSLETDALEVTVDGASTSTDRGLYPVVDLGAYSEVRDATITLRNTSLLPIVYPDTGPVLDGDSRIRIKSSTCAATLRSGAECTVVVTFSPGSECSVEADAVLRFAATSSAAGQTALKLTGGGRCPALTTFPPLPATAAAADACTGPSEYKWDLPAVEQPQRSEGKPHQYFPLGLVRAGEVGISALSIHNDWSQPVTPSLTSPGCQLKLVLPAGAPADACKPGQPMPPRSTCTAFVEHLLTDVVPFSASIQLFDTVYRIGGHAVRRVAAVWRDPGATGAFGPARIASVTGLAGTVMDGAGPTVSADGRFVGFVSDTALGRPPVDPAAVNPPTQIYLHDTDAQGNGTYEPGETTLVSLKPDGALPMTSTQPSVSDDGTRIAFSGWAPVPGNPDANAQVYVRDLPAKRSVLASAAPDGALADEWSHTPVLSGDGYTVAYLTNASNLGVGTLPGDRVVARDLTKDMAGQRGTNDLVSARENGAGTNTYDRFPVLSQNGAFVAFTSRDSFDRYNDTDSDDDVYRARRQADVTVVPETLDFGAAKVGTSSGSRPVTVTNSGGVPVQFEEPDSFARSEFPLAGDQCNERLLRPGQSCSYLFRFQPRAVGVRGERLWAYASEVAGYSPAVEARLTGRGTSDARTAGETSQVSTNDGQHTDPAISDNGQFVAYRTGGTGADDRPTAISVKNQATGEIRRWAEHGRVGPPVMSADGTRVAFAGLQGRSEQVWIADGSAEGETALSGTTEDLRYQRPPECYSQWEDRDCRPALSGDGKTVAFAARLDSASEALQVEQVVAEGDAKPIDSLVDFGTGQSVTLRVTVDRPVRFDGPPVVDPGSRFTVASSTCTGQLAEDASCTIALTFSSCANGARTGLLRLAGSTPEGRTAISLVSNAGCVIIHSQPQSGGGRGAAAGSGSARPTTSGSQSAQPPRVRAQDFRGRRAGEMSTRRWTASGSASCEPIAAMSYQPVLSTGETNAGHPLADNGTLPLGSLRYTAIAVTPQTTAQTVQFASGCEFALVDNTRPDPELPKPCVNGQVLPANTGCTAYVGFRAGTVDPSVAYLTASVGSGTTYYRFTGAGYQDVVLTRTQQDNDTFAAPVIANLDSSGKVIPGKQPSLSGDGRYLAFVTSDPYEELDTVVDRIYRRDRTGGSTVLVSQLADGEVGVDDAMHPDLSADGNRIAFTTDGYSDEGRTRSSKNKSSKSKSPEHGSPQSKSSEDGSPEGSSSKRGSSEGGSPEGSSSKRGSSEGGSPEGSSSERGSSEGSSSKRGASAHGSPEGGSSEGGSSEGGSSEGGSSEGGSSEGRARGGARSVVASRPSQVWARDIAAGKTVLVSARADSPTTKADGWSFEPSMADDGSTVGFASDAGDLVREPGNDDTAVYVRYLEPDFTGRGERFAERVSLTAEGAVADEGSSSSPALSSDGAFTAFDSYSKLVAGDADTYPDIYVRRRPAQLVIEPAMVDFGSVQVGKSSSPRQLMVRNLGPGPVTAGPAATITPFSTKNNVCRTSLHRGESCPIDGVFKPATVGRVGGVLTLPSVQGYLTGPSVSAGLTGTGTVTPPVAGFSVTPNRLVFPGQELGKAAPRANLLLRNTGQVPLEVSRVLQSDGDFGIDDGVCTTVMPGTSCRLPVTFAPRKAGTRTGTIVFRPRSADLAAANPAAVRVALSGTGIAPSGGSQVAAMTVMPRALVFGQQVLLTPSAPQSVVVLNSGTAPLTVSAVSTSQEFTIAGACGRVLPGRNCVLPVRFVPSALGVRTGTIRISATATGAAAPFPVTVSLRGVTANPVLTVDPPVVRPGQIVLASGRNFPPNRSVVLAWKTGIGTHQAVADSTGRFQAAVLVFRRDSLGQRFLTATTPSHPQPIHSPAVLVMPLSPHPPDFVLRW